MSRAIQKVWSICRFRERFEMTGEYERKTGLEYVRQFIGAGGLKSTESTQFLSQLRELKHYYPDRHYHFRGVFDELLGLAGTVELRFRGFLLNSRLKPATMQELAARLDITVAEMREAMKALDRVGLIERIDLPMFGEDPTDERSIDREDQGKAKAKRRVRGRTKKVGKQGAKSASRNNSETFPNRSEAFAHTDMANGKAKDNINGQMAKGKGKAHPKGAGPRETPTSPTTSPPLPTVPPKATGEGPRHFLPAAERQRTEAPSRVCHGPRILSLRPGDGKALGELLPRAMDGLTHGYTLRADEFASEIFSLLRAPFTPDSRDGLRERGNYRAALLEAIDGGLSPPQIEQLMTKGRQDAARIAKHRKRYYRNGGSPETYWRFLWNKHLAARRDLPAAGRKAGAG